MRSITLREVADRSKVSVATVSAVVNGATWVPDDTRKRVQKAIDKLGYRPNQLARGLKTRRGHAIGVIVSDLTNPFFTEIVRSLSHSLRESGRAIFLCDSDHRFEVADLNLRMLVDGHIAGLVLVGDTVREETLRGYVRRHPRNPVIAIEREYAVDGVSTLLVDSEAGAYAVTRHLLDQQYSRIGIITGPHEGPGSTTFGRAARYDGYCRALTDAGRAIDPALVAEGNFRHAGGLDAMRHLLSNGARPDAVFASNDLMALGAIDAAREAGLRVPQDIAITGWDDVPFAAFTTPSLTTVAMPKSELGRVAAELLVDQLTPERHAAVRKTLSARLVVRQSSCR